MKRVGVYSGTFDPVHAGHVGFARVALELCGLERVVFLPERMPRGKAEVSDYCQRLRGVQMVVRDFRGLDVLELADEQFSAEQTLPQLQRQFADAQLVLLLGSDVVRTFAYRWPGLDKMLAQVELVVGLRQGDEHREIAALLADWPAACYQIIASPHPELSSSQLRG